MTTFDPDWWKRLFDETYLITDARSVCDERVTRSEVDFLVVYSRVMVAALVLVAVVLGWLAQTLVFWLVLFAWAGLGAALGPTSILALYWKGVTRAGVFAGLHTGTVATFAWNLTPALDALIYELIPAYCLLPTVYLWLSSSRTV